MCYPSSRTPSRGGARSFVLTRVGRRALSFKDDLTILAMFMLGRDYLSSGKLPAKDPSRDL